MALLNLSGKIVMLRVNEVGDSFGKPPDNFVVEVVVQLDSHAAGAASGFQLRADGNQPARQGMLDLLRDAFNNGWRVHVDHEVPAGKTKGTIIRTWITKDPTLPVTGTIGGVFGTLTPATPAPASPVVPTGPGTVIGVAPGPGRVRGKAKPQAEAPAGTIVFKTVSTKPER
jgi:hypothetical protein